MTLDAPISTQPYRLTKPDLDEFARCVSPRRGHWILVAATIVALLAAAVTIAEVAVARTLSWAAIAAAGMLLGFAIALFLAWRAMQPTTRARATMRRLRDSEFLAEHVYEFTEQGLIHRSDLSETLIRWHAIRNVEVTPVIISLYIAPQVAHIIPKRAIGDAAAVETLLTQIDRWRTAAQPYERTCPRCGYALREGKSLGCPECGWRRE